MTDPMLPENFETFPVIGYRYYADHSQGLPLTSVYREKVEGVWTQLPTFTGVSSSSPDILSFRSGDMRVCVGTRRSIDGLTWSPIKATGTVAMNYQGKPILAYKTPNTYDPDTLHISYNLGRSFVNRECPQLEGYTLHYPAALTWTPDGCIHYIGGHPIGDEYGEPVEYYHWYSDDLGQTWSEPHYVFTPPVEWSGGEIHQTSARGMRIASICASGSKVCFAYIEDWTEQYYNRGGPGALAWYYVWPGGHYDLHEPTNRYAPCDLIVFTSEDYGATWSWERVKNDTIPAAWGGFIVSGIGGYVGFPWEANMQCVAHGDDVYIVAKLYQTNKLITGEEHYHGYFPSE